MAINEGVSCHAVHFYGALVMKDSADLVLVFQSLFPRLRVLLQVFVGEASFGRQGEALTQACRVRHAHTHPRHSPSHTTQYHGTRRLLGDDSSEQ